MRRSSRNTIIGLFVMTLVLGLSALFVGTSLQGDLAPEDSEASGWSCDTSCDSATQDKECIPDAGCQAQGKQLCRCKSKPAPPSGGTGTDCATKCATNPCTVGCIGGNGCGDASSCNQNSDGCIEANFWCSGRTHSGCNERFGSYLPTAPNPPVCVTRQWDELCVDRTDAEIYFYNASGQSIKNTGHSDAEIDAFVADCNEKNPKGYHDVVDCDKVAGWACDGDDYNASLAIHIYQDGPAGTGTLIGDTVASGGREQGVADACGGNANHGFSFNLPASSKDGGSHEYYVYAINVGSGSNQLIGGSPKTLDTSTCTGPECGDGNVDAGEACDDGNQIDDDACSNSCEINPECGDGNVDAGEACDDGNQVDDDACSNSCEINLRCGDNVCSTGEACDGVKQCTGGGEWTEGECRADCTYCGDGNVNGNEECDDGNTNDSDSCSNSCIQSADCGNGTCDNGETCDGTVSCPGNQVMPSGSVCRSSCDYCGDGQRDAGEECDDSNNINGDGCSSTCRIEECVNCFETPICGNGEMEIGEECEPSIPNSCGPGGECNSSTCLCQPIIPGVCGSSCSNDIECPTDNVCYGGRCRLAICAPSYGVVSSPYSGVISGTRVANNIVCTSNGCEVVTCGGNCGPGGMCPNGLGCNSQGMCVLNCCVDNPKCGENDLCSLCPTALIGEEVDMIILSLLMVMVGVLSYRVDITKKLWENFRVHGGKNITQYFTRHGRKKVAKKKRGKSRENFESKFTGKKKKKG